MKKNVNKQLRIEIKEMYDVIMVGHVNVQCCGTQITSWALLLGIGHAYFKVLKGNGGYS
jgi:hypothetical protein